MNRLGQNFCGWHQGLFGALIFLCFGFITAQGAPEANGTNRPASIIKSVFEDPASKPGALRDPFFPKTKRPPYAEAVVVVRSPDKPVAKPADPYEGVDLKGISGPAGRKLALINNQTLAVGESANVKRSDGSTIEIQVVDIKDTSVVIKTKDAEPKEIRLKRF